VKVRAAAIPWSVVRSAPILGLLLLALGCAGTGGPGATAQWVHFQSGVGKDAFDLRRSGSDITLFNANDRVLVSVVRKGDVWHVADSEGRRVGRVARIQDSIAPRFGLSGRADEQGDLELKIEQDGDLKLKDASEREIFKLKQRDYGFKIVDSEGQTIGRVRLSEEGKISVRDENNLTYLSTRDPMPLEAATLLMVPGLDLASATGLSAVLWQWQEARP
jgi:hypothetical protein